MLGSDTGSEDKKNKMVWLITFADLMSLLMAFFVMLFTFSKIDNKKFEQLDSSMRQAFGNVIVQPELKNQKLNLIPFLPPLANQAEEETVDTAQTERDAENIKKILNSQIASNKVQVEQYKFVIIIRLLDSSFSPGSAELSPDMKPILKVVGQALNTTHGEIFVSGYTDDIPIKNSIYRSNWELSAARAYSVIAELTEQGGLDAERLILRGFGEHRPLVSNDSSTNRAKNRRVDIMIDQGEIENKARGNEDEEENLLFLTRKGLQGDKVNNDFQLMVNDKEEEE